MRPHEASAEVQSPKRKVVRVETEETQDYERESLAISQEEAEEMGFVPSAVGEPRGAIYWCDNRCSEKAIRDYSARNQFERFWSNCANRLVEETWPMWMFLPPSGDVEIHASRVLPSDPLLPATLSRLRLSASVSSAFGIVFSNFLQLLAHYEVLLHRNIQLLP